MADEPRYVLLTPAALQPRAAFSLVGSAFKLSLTLGAVFFVAFGSYLMWRWADENLLHWGIDDAKTTRVDRSELLERLQVFQLVSVKDRYSTQAEVDIDKVFSAGPARFSLPGWMAGQTMRVSGEVIVAAGVDLADVTADDIEVRRQGESAHVIITVPEPEIMSTELVADTMDLRTSQGVLTRLKTRLGFDEKDLRDEAADGLMRSAQREAAAGPLLTEAGRQVQSRLQGLFATMPGNENITYELQFRPRRDG
jgi:hypothetical protein